MLVTKHIVVSIVCRKLSFLIFDGLLRQYQPNFNLLLDFLLLGHNFIGVGKQPNIAQKYPSGCTGSHRIQTQRTLLVSTLTSLFSSVSLHVNDTIFSPIIMISRFQSSQTGYQPYSDTHSPTASILCPTHLSISLSITVIVSAPSGGSSVTSKKSPNVYKSCPKMILLEQ